MSDDPFSDTWLRASAYLDNALDDVERALAEADPGVMVEAERMAAIRSLHVDVEPPSAAAREMAISAALLEFDRSPRQTGAVSSRSRPLATRWLAVAAAFVAVGALALVVTQLPNGGDDSDEVGTAFEATAEQSKIDVAEGAVAAQPQATSAPAAAGDTDAADSMMVLEAPAATEAVAAEDAPVPEGSPSELSPSTVLLTPDVDLAELARGLLADEAAGLLVTSPERAVACPQFTADTLVVDAVDATGTAATAWLLAVDRTSSAATLVESDTCAVVRRAP